MSRDNRILIPVTHSRGTISVWSNPPYALFGKYWRLIEAIKIFQNAYEQGGKQQAALHHDITSRAIEAEMGVLASLWFSGRHALPMTKNQVKTLSVILGPDEYANLITQTVSLIEAHYARVN